MFLPWQYLRQQYWEGDFCNTESLLSYKSFSLHIIIDPARFKWNKAWSGPQGKKDGYVPILPNDSAFYNCVAFF